MGARVDVVEAYHTVKPEIGKVRVEGMLEKREIDMVTFTSSSTVTNFLEMFNKESRQISKWMTDVAAACIGPITARTAEENGLKVHLIPESYTIESLTGAIVKYFS